MSTASTTVFLYVGLDNERRTKGKGEWPSSQGGHIELVDWLESMAVHLDRLYDAEFAQLDLSCVFDYEITEELGAWLYHNDDVAAFAVEARRLVAEVQVEAAKRMERK